MIIKEELIKRLENYLHYLKNSEISSHELYDAWPFDQVIIESIDSARLKAIEEQLNYLVANNERMVCGFSSNESAKLGYPQFLVARGVKGREEGNNRLTRWIKDASTLTIVDPYFLTSGNYKKAKDYSDALESIFPPSLKRFEVFFNPKYREENVANCLNEVISGKHISRTFYATDDIHDRIWIKERKKDGAISGKVIGCSFHNLGKKPTYILDLPHSDLEDLMKDLRYLREQSRVAHNV